MPWSNRAPAMHLSSIKREKMRRQPRKGTLEEASFGRLAAITVEGRTLRIAWDVGAEKKSALQQKNGNKWIRSFSSVRSDHKSVNEILS